jgi:polyphosphate kinase
VLLRVADPRLSGKLGEMFDSCLDPATRCWTLHADGPWEPSPPNGAGVVHVRDHQAEMMIRHSAVPATEPE